MSATQTLLFREDAEGVYVSLMTADAKSRLQLKDRVVAVDSTPITSIHTLFKFFMNPSKALVMKVRRNGKQQSIKLVPSDFNYVSFAYF